MKQLPLLIISLACLTGYSQTRSNAEVDKMINEWQKEQDSLRTIILDSKENDILKTSLLQEPYIRNVVHEENDTLYFNIHRPAFV